MFFDFYNVRSFFAQQREISDIKLLLRVLKMYIPLPVFWALFHQQVKYFICWNIVASTSRNSVTIRRKRRYRKVTAQLLVTKGNKNNCYQKQNFFVSLCNSFRVVSGEIKLPRKLCHKSSYINVDLKSRS